MIVNNSQLEGLKNQPSIIAAKRYLLENNFLKFLQWNFKNEKGKPFKINSHHKEMANYFEKVFSGEIRKLIINIPPRYSKTEFLKQFCLAGFAKNPASEFIYTSYSQTLVNKFSKSIRDGLLEEKYKELWGVRIKRDDRATGSWKTTKGGSFIASPMGGQLTGFGAGKLDDVNSKGEYNFGGALIIDDPNKPKDRHYPTALSNSWDFFGGTLNSRFNSSRTPLIIVMQRICPEDFVGRFMKGEKDWTLLSMPILTDGIPLWEERHNIKDIKELENTKNETFQAQYQQNPIKLGGNIIKTKLFNYFDLDNTPKIKRRFLVADTAMKDKETADYSVIQCWGVGENGNSYLLDQIRGKWESPELRINLVNFWNKHNNQQVYNHNFFGILTICHIEDKVSGTSLIQEIEASYNIPVSPVQRRTKKIERVLDILLPRMSSGYVFLPSGADFLSDLTSECERFTYNNSHKHDDQIDCLVDGVFFCSNSTNNEKSAEFIFNRKRR